MYVVMRVYVHDSLYHAVIVARDYFVLCGMCGFFVVVVILSLIILYSAFLSFIFLFLVHTNARHTHGIDCID